jgi:hypothetical protein
MSFLKKLIGIGNRQRTDNQQPATQEPGLEKPPASNEPKTMDDQQLKTDIAAELRRKTEEHMAILRFLCTCGKFDRDKVTTYFSMAEKIGMQWEEQDKHRMLNAALIFPKRQSDGTVLNGFEQVREMLMQSHAEALSKGVTVFKQLLPTLPLNESTVKANADFLVKVGSESKELIRTLLSNRS